MVASGVLASVRRYPVKSMMGEELNSAFVTATGLFGDRSYALCDNETGKVVSAKNPKKWPNLFSYRAAYTSPPVAGSPLPSVRVTLPDGAMSESTSAEFAPKISGMLGKPVRLITAPPPEAELEEYWPDMPELANRDVVTDEAMPKGTFFDLAILHILTTSTLDKLRELNSSSRFEPRRFRPNFIIDTSGQKGFVENNWIGRTFALGPEVQIEVTGPCPRCVMTTLAQGDLPNDPMILKTAAQANQVRVGIYASVVKTGTVRIGDTISLV